MLILLLLTCSCVPVLAYDPSTVDLRSFPHSSFIDPETAVEVSIDTENTMEVTFLQTIDNIPSDEVYFKYNDSYFITDNGDIFSVRNPPYILTPNALTVSSLDNIKLIQ